MSQAARQTQHPISEIFTKRWSPRAFEPKTLPESELLRLFEAARWAPSAYNLQPWRFVYAHRDTPEFDALLATLVPFNQDWAKNASVLAYVVSVKHFEAAKPIADHSFSTGAAWMALALQANQQGLITHGMGGFDADAAAKAINLPENMKIEAALAIGYHGAIEYAPEALRGAETPSGRNEIDSFAFNGKF